MRENCTYGSMRGRAYPTRGAPLYSTPFVPILPAAALDAPIAAAEETCIRDDRLAGISANMQSNR